MLVELQNLVELDRAVVGLAERSHRSLKDESWKKVQLYIIRENK